MPLVYLGLGGPARIRNFSGRIPAADKILAGRVSVCRSRAKTFERLLLSEERMFWSVESTTPELGGAAELKVKTWARPSSAQE